jgi:ABC-type multidrug transport system ATPase subunit
MSVSEYKLFLKINAKAGVSFHEISGGQQRRVSFACSLIHNPELLILDEPTVGVDALLRQRLEFDMIL